MQIQRRNRECVVDRVPLRKYFCFYQVVDPSVRKQSLKELMQEFYGLILAYDEGLLSHDRVLAASIWRNMFQNKKSTDALNLASFVEYIRKQVLHLDGIDSEKLFTTGKIEWLPFEGRVYKE